MSNLKQLIREVFEFFKDHFVFVVAILIVSAAINIKFYYSFLYQFDVIPYVSVQEILAFSFLSLGKLNIPIIIAILILIIIIEVALSANNSRLFSTNSIIRAKKIMLNGLLMIPIYEFLELCIYLLFPNYIEPHKNLSIDFTKTGYIIDFISVIIFILLYFLDSHSILISTHKTTYVIVILSVISAGTFSNSLKSGLESKYLKSYQGTKIIVENDTIISTRRLMYIGQTNGYIFHYDFDKNRTDVIPISQVKKIEIISGQK